MKKYTLLKSISSLAMLLSVYSANAACTFVFHQPTMPEAAKALRKF